MFPPDRGNGAGPLGPIEGGDLDPEMSGFDFIDLEPAKPKEEDRDTVGVGLHFHEKLRNKDD